MPVEAVPEIGANAPVTLADLYRLDEAGAFGGLQTELIGGRISFKMPQNRLHSACVMMVIEALLPLKPRGLFTDTQGTVEISPTEGPMPDVFLTRLDPRVSTREFVGSDLLLTVEVAVSTLYADRRDKARQYAEAGVPDYWIVNPAGGQVEVYRKPEGGEYAERIVYGPGESVSPLAAPDHVIPVADLMPPLDA